MKYVLSILAVVMVAGCANATRTRIVSASPRTVAVVSFKGMQDAQTVADGECKQHQRFARWIGGDAPNFIFDCVQ